MASTNCLPRPSTKLVNSTKPNRMAHVFQNGFQENPPHYPPVLVARNMTKEQVVLALVAQARVLQEKELQAAIRAGRAVQMTPTTPESHFSLTLGCGCVYYLKRIGDVEDHRNVPCFHGNFFIQWVEDRPPAPPTQRHRCARCDNVGCLQPCLCACHREEHGS